MKQYLEVSDIIDWETDCVLEKALELSTGIRNKTDIAKVCFEWVRDEIKHSLDYKLGPVTITASEVLLNNTGFCYAKSHLLAALLRANDIPSGLCYQRLKTDSNSGIYCLHGLNAVYLDRYGWYRMDPRGNTVKVNTSFTPPVESIAYPVLTDNEFDIPVIYSYPIRVVIEAMRNSRSAEELAVNLPDTEKFNILYRNAG